MARTKNNRESEISPTIDTSDGDRRSSSVRIPKENTWWEIAICLVSQVGNLYRLRVFSLMVYRYHAQEGYSLSPYWVQFELICLFVGGWVVTDFVSGLYHWFADSYRTHNPSINAIFFDNFQLHHAQPMLICQRPLANVSWEVSVPSFLLTIATISTIHIAASTSTVIAAVPRAAFFVSAFVSWLSWTNQAHRWAHQVKPVPGVVRVLQRVRIFVSPQHHRQHHSQNHLQDYCITSGICNPILNFANFWRRLEALVFWICGAKSYAMLLNDPKAYAKSPFADMDFHASAKSSTNKEQKERETKTKHPSGAEELAFRGKTTRTRGKEAEAQGHTHTAGTTSYLYDALLSPFYDTLAACLWPRWVHPNIITILGGMFCSSAIYIYAFGLGNNDDSAKKWVCIGWTLYHMCDNMDGKHARRTQQASIFGGFLDHVVDGLFGVYMGYCAVAGVIFGVPIGSTLFNTGRHCFCLLWIAPHVVHQLEPRRGLVLGTKLCSVDEGFLGVSALLFYHGWIDASPLLPNHDAAGLLLAHIVTAIAIGFVAWSAMKMQSTKSRRHRCCWTTAYLLFAVIGYGIQDPVVWWTLWTPFMMVSVAAH